MRRFPALPIPVFLVLLALALRCYKLDAPLLDYHSWRQADTAAIARNFAAHGYRLFYPQVDWGGSTPGYVETEFPLYSFTLALLYGLFGVHEWVGRLLTALCGAATPAALYALALPSSGRRAACYTGVALALMPFAIYFGRAVMPDTLMLLTATLALLTLQRWLAAPTPRRFALALLCGALAPLSKTPNLLIVAVPLVFLALSAGALRRRWVALLCYAAVFALPALLWSIYARTLPLDPRLSFGIGAKLFDLHLLADPQFYLLLATWSLKWVVTPVGLPFFVLGLCDRTKNQEPRTRSFTRSLVHPFIPSLCHAWLLGVVLFLLVGAAGVVGQDYYILPLSVPAAWLIGIGLARAQQWLDERRATSDERRTTTSQGSRLPPPASRLPPPASRFLVLGSWLLLALWSAWAIAPLYCTADFYRALGVRLDLALPAGARVGVVAPAVSEVLYYSGRQGWRLDPGVLVPGGLASLAPDLGVRYVLIADPWLSERRAVLDAVLRDYRRVYVGPYALLLDLAKTAPAAPFELDWATGHTVGEPFLSYWQQAGVAQLGLPISEALDAPEGQAQYFERGLLITGRKRPKRAPVGQMLLAAEGRAPQRAEVDSAFRAAWQAAGGSDGLGAALTPVLATPAGRVQYYEYGTLEQATGGSPQVGASGRRLLELRGLTEERQITLLRAR